MRTSLRATATVVAVSGLTAALVVGPSIAYSDDDRKDRTSSNGDGRDKLDVVGLTDGGKALVTFDTNRPDKTSKPQPITGLTGGDAFLHGIDYRVQDGKLYGLGSNQASAGVYTVDVRTGAATLVNRLSVALNGTLFGFDFNPAADRLRVISDVGQNLRHNVNAGGVTIPDGTLAYTPGTPAAGITAGAYTNNDIDPSTATTLFDLDTTMDQVALQSPANAGTLAATGKLGKDVASNAGFDIYSVVRDGKTVAALPYAVATVVGGDTRLFEIDLLTGAASDEGRLGDQGVTDIAIPLNQL